MPGLLKASRSLAGLAIFFSLGCSIALIGASGNVPKPPAQRRQPKGAEVAGVNAALQDSFGSTVAAENGFKPFSLTGDFNGDGAEDILIVVRIKGRRSELPKDVKLLNPFGYGAKPAFDSSAETALALAIIHGGRAGWRRSPAAAKFLLLGESPILILENSKAKSDHPGDRNNLMEMISKRGPHKRGATRPPPAARGDSILLGTEAAESVLYWDGRTYRWKESEGGE